MQLPHESSMDQVLSGGFAPPRLQLWPPDSFRVVDWNIDRGTHLAGVLQFLKSCKADLIFLQEVDLNAERTHKLDVAREIARSLQLNYVFGKEFQELTQGSLSSPAYQGQAVLSPWPIMNPRIIRFDRQSAFWRPHWYLPRIAPFQERLGGRIALVAEVEICGQRVATYNLHLESKEGDALRFQQLQEVLSDVALRPGGYPVLLGGDLNLDISVGPSAAALREAGFADAVGLPELRTRPSRGIFDPGRTIDWMLFTGPLKCSQGRIHRDIRASDHCPLSFVLSASRAACGHAM
jgi:endonuclease/exonuclease/phosphatase family metal-dependent hydrolase